MDIKKSFFVTLTKSHILSNFNFCSTIYNVTVKHQNASSGLQRDNQKVACDLYICTFMCSVRP